MYLLLYFWRNIDNDVFWPHIPTLRLHFHGVRTFEPKHHSCYSRLYIFIVDVDLLQSKIRTDNIIFRCKGACIDVSYYNCIIIGSSTVQQTKCKFIRQSYYIHLKSFFFISIWVPVHLRNWIASICITAETQI